MNDNNKPRPEFVANLEWQVRSAARRRSRFAEPAETGGGRKMSMIVLILVSALMGAGGVVVKDQVQESRAREVRLARVAGEMRMADAEMEVARNRMDEVETRHAAGIVGEEALLMARVNLMEAETKLQTLQLNHREIEASGREPRNELAAPLVDGEDFVTQRIGLETNLANERLNLARFRMERAEELVRVGAVQETELSQARMALLQAESQLEDLEHRISLRRDFLAGEVTQEEVERQAEIFSTRTRIELARERFEQSATRFRRAEELANRGIISGAELDQARLDLMQVENELDVLEVTLATLQGR